VAIGAVAGPSRCTKSVTCAVLSHGCTRKQLDPSHTDVLLVKVSSILSYQSLLQLNRATDMRYRQRLIVTALTALVVCIIFYRRASLESAYQSRVSHPRTILDADHLSKRDLTALTWKKETNEEFNFTAAHLEANSEYAPGPADARCTLPRPRIRH
jgi:hypothetical protein